MVSGGRLGGRRVAAVERATAKGLPLLAAPVSGGTRMQEETVAFVQMVRISAAVAGPQGRSAAVHGFLGPRVYEALYDRAFPEGVQTSEDLYAHGLVDAVVPPAEIADILDRALTVLLAPRTALGDIPDPVDEEVPDVDAWESVTRSRRHDRPGVRRLVKYAATDVIPLNGTGAVLRYELAALWQRDRSTLVAQRRARYHTIG